MKRARNEACLGKRTELQELHPAVGEEGTGSRRQAGGSALHRDLVIHLRRESRCRSGGQAEKMST